MLRLAQGRPDTAAAAIQRTLTETTDPLERARLLPAAVEILLAAADAAGARDAARELTDIAGSTPGTSSGPGPRSPGPGSPWPTGTRARR